MDVAKMPEGILQQLRLPLRDQVRINVKLRGEHRQRLVTLERSDCHLARGPLCGHGEVFSFLLLCYKRLSSFIEADLLLIRQSCCGATSLLRRATDCLLRRHAMRCTGIDQAIPVRVGEQIQPVRNFELAVN